MTHNFKFTSTKAYSEIAPCAYRQWKADSHCAVIHGYSFSFKFEFSTDELDLRNWACDYGSLRPLKELLEEYFDHTLLCSDDDPHKDAIINLQTLGIAKVTMLPKVGCEAIADMLYEYVNNILLDDYQERDRLWCTRVEVRETSSNMAYRSGSRDLNRDGEEPTPEKPWDGPVTIL